MLKNINRVFLGTALFLSTATATATTIIFDGNHGGVHKSGTVETATGDYHGNPDVYGEVLHFTGFDVLGGYSVGDNLNEGRFHRGQVEKAFVDQDLHPGNGGLGVCAESFKCAGSSDSFSSNLNNNFMSDEILFFDFDALVSLDTVWFNGDHHEYTDSNGGAVQRPSEALFNIYYSLDGLDYTNVFSDQMRPTDLDFLSVAAGDFRYWAIAASGWGQHDSYVEAIRYTEVPEPSLLVLFGLGILGLGLARRRRLR